MRAIWIRCLRPRPHPADCPRSRPVLVLDMRGRASTLKSRSIAFYRALDGTRRLSHPLSSGGVYYAHNDRALRRRGRIVFKKKRYGVAVSVAFTEVEKEIIRSADLGRDVLYKFRNTPPERKWDGLGFILVVLEFTGGKPSKSHSHFLRMRPSSKNHLLPHSKN